MSSLMPATIITESNPNMNPYQMIHSQDRSFVSNLETRCENNTTANDKLPLPNIENSSARKNEYFLKFPLTTRYHPKKSISKQSQFCDLNSMPNQYGDVLYVARRNPMLSDMPVHVASDTKKNLQLKNPIDNLTLHQDKDSPPSPVPSLELSSSSSSSPPTSPSKAFRYSSLSAPASKNLTTHTLLPQCQKYSLKKLWPWQRNFKPRRTGLGEDVTREKEGSKIYTKRREPPLIPLSLNEAPSNTMDQTNIGNHMCYGPHDHLYKQPPLYRKHVFPPQSLPQWTSLNQDNIHGFEQPPFCSPLPIPCLFDNFQQKNLQNNVDIPLYWQNDERFIRQNQRNFFQPPKSDLMPQNLRSDPLRQKKIKTELCTHWKMGRRCPFGDRCNYAHGEQDLKYTKLVDMERAGLIDGKTFRCHPCQFWVSTGACPYGQRCCSLHDPRLRGTRNSWLLHTDVPVANLGRDTLSRHSQCRQLNMNDNTIYVDRKYNCELELPRRTNPLIDPDKIRDEATKNEELEWKYTYSKVCNILNNSTSFVVRAPKREGQISEIAFIEIALAFVDRSSSFYLDFTYHASSLIYGEPCMILQTKTFHLIQNQKRKMNSEASSFVFETGDERYEGSCNETVTTVRMIAFGPMGENMRYPVALWFDIPDMDIQPCSPQLAKKRSRFNSVNGHKIYKERAESLQQSRRLFVLPNPVDADAERLIISILNYHRCFLNDYTIGKCESMKFLKAAYFAQKKHLSLWAWPVNCGREYINDNLDVPQVDTPYKPKQPLIQTYTPYIWNSFLKMLDINFKASNKKLRLDIFQHLSAGKSIYEYNSDIKSLPLLTSIDKGIQKKSTISHRSYKSLLECDIIWEKWEELKRLYLANVAEAPKTF